MIRRTFLKALLATPLAGLFKKKEPECKEELAQTTGISSEGELFYWSEERGVWTERQLHPLGTRHTDNAGRVWTYVQWHGQ